MTLAWDASAGAVAYILVAVLWGPGTQEQRSGWIDVGQTAELSLPDPTPTPDPGQCWLFRVDAVDEWGNRSRE